MKKHLQVLALCIISLFGLLSCGLEEFYYIEFISNVDQTSNVSVQVQLPSDGSPGYGSSEYFNNFIIFYRIYLSNFPASSLLPGDFSAINSTMSSNYNSLYRYTDKTSSTVTSENLETIFYNSSFFKLALEGRDINEVLSRTSLGKTLQFNFSEGTVGGIVPIPSLVLSGDEPINLWRAADKPGINFTTRPDNFRYFMNYEDIRNTDFAPPVSNEFNADVAIRTNEPDTTLSYVLFYIAAQGITSEMPPRPIFSQPTYLGMFKLPNAN